MLLNTFLSALGFVNGTQSIILIAIFVFCLWGAVKFVLPRMSGRGAALLTLALIFCGCFLLESEMHINVLFMAGKVIDKFIR